MWRTIVDYFIEHADVILPTVTLVCLAIAGFRTNQRRERREFTQRLLAVGLEEQHLSHADYVIYRFMMRCRDAGVDTAPRQDGPAGYSEELQEALRVTLNYYQQIAASYRCGILDQDFVMMVRGVYMRRLFLFFENYIAAVRLELSRPELYGELEALAKGDAAAFERKVMNRLGAAHLAS